MRYDCLVIDDEEMLADSTAQYFNLFGVKTAVVYSAMECLDFFKHNDAKLVLLDINLGGSSGFENVWEDKFTGDGTLNVHICKIREAIENEPGNPLYIITVWGGGYRFSGGR